MVWLLKYHLCLHINGTIFTKITHYWKWFISLIHAQNLISSCTAYLQYCCNHLCNKHDTCCFWWIMHISDKKGNEITYANNSVIENIRTFIGQIWHYIKKYNRMVLFNILSRWNGKMFTQRKELFLRAWIISAILNFLSAQPSHLWQMQLLKVPCVFKWT